MHSTNPVLSRPDAFTSQQQQAQPGYPQQGYPQQGGFQQPQYGYQQPGQQFPGQPYAPQQPVQAARGVMTIDDVITKTAITLGALIITAALTFMFLPIELLYPSLIISGLVGFVTVLFVSFRRLVNPALVLLYAAIEGIFIGAFSLLFETMFPGIVVQAVLGTFAAAGVTLAAYKAFRIKVTNRFRKVVLISTMAFAGVMLINLVMAMFGVDLGLRTVGGGFNMLALVASAIGVVLAVFNLIMDFDYIEQGIAMQAPASESWRGAFGLTVTMVWLYTELLRILSYFRSN